MGGREWNEDRAWESPFARMAFAYFFSDKIALSSSGAQPVSREQLPRLYAVMERLAAKANLPVPKLYVIPEAAPNAFATGAIRSTLPWR